MNRKDVPCLEVSFLSGNDEIYVPTFFDCQSVELLLSELQSIVPEADDGNYVAVVKVRNGLVRGIDEGGVQFKVSRNVGFSALDRFALFLRNLAKFIVVSEPLALNPPLTFPMLFHGHAGLQLSLQDYENPIMGGDGVLIPNETNTVVEFSFINYDLNMVKLAKSLQACLPAGPSERSLYLTVRPVKCYIPGIGAVKDNFYLAISDRSGGFESKVVDVAKLVAGLRGHAIPINESLQPEENQKVHQFYGSMQLPVKFPTGAKTLKLPVEVVEQVPFTDNGDEEEFVVPQVQENTIIVISYMDTSMQGILQTKYKIEREGVTAQSLRLMHYYEHYQNCHGVNQLHPEFVLRMMYWANMTFSEVCMWFHRKKHVEVAMNVIHVYRLSKKMRSDARSNCRKDLMYRLLEEEVGKLPGNQCTLCLDGNGLANHPGMFCMMFPTIHHRHNKLRNAHRCIGCGKKCLVKGYSHKTDPTVKCDICASDAHVDYLCPSEYAQTRIQLVVHKIMVMAGETFCWSEDDFNLLEYCMAYKNIDPELYLVNNKKNKDKTEYRFQSQSEHAGDLWSL